METIKLWESNLKDNFIYFNTVKEYLDYIEKFNLIPELSFKETYTPPEEPKNFIETSALKKDNSITYTDKDHPILYDPKNFIPSVMNESLFKENLPLFKEKARQALIQNLKFHSKTIYIPDYLYHSTTLEDIIKEEHLDIPLSSLQDKTYYYIETTTKLSEKDIKNIKDNHLEFYVKNKNNVNKISSQFAIEYYTYQKLKEEYDLTITLPLSSEEIENFNYINPKAQIKINFGYVNPKAQIKIYSSHDTKQDELPNFYALKELLEKLSHHNNTYQITFEVNNRALLKKSNLLSNIPSNVTLFIKNDGETYDLNTYLEEENKLDNLVAPIIKANLSPLEKYIAVYNIVKKFKNYQESPNNPYESRFLKYILNNEYIVCVGFSNLLVDLLRRVNIPVSDLSAEVDISYDLDKSMNETPLNTVGHARNLVKIDDDKYNIHGIYMADATWDNYLNDDYYLNSLLTFDQRKEAIRLESLNTEDLLMDFHNKEELFTKVSYYVKRKISTYESSHVKPDLIYILTSIYNEIMSKLQKLDYQKYNYFYDKYEDKLKIIKYNFNIKDKPSELNKIINEFLEEYYEYMLPLTNKNINLDTIINAAYVVKEKVDKLNPSELSTWLDTTKKSNEKGLSQAFPYIYNPNNKTEAYLENRPKKTL